MTQSQRVFSLTELSGLAAEMNRRRRLRRNGRLYVLASDLLTIAVAFAVTGLVRWGNPFHGHVGRMFLSVMPLFATFAATGRAYASRVMAEPWAGSLAVFRAFALAIATLAMIVFFLRANTDLSRTLFSAGALLALIGLPVSRYVLAAKLRGRIGEETFNYVLIQDGVASAAAEGSFVLTLPPTQQLTDFHQPDALDRLGRCLQFADRVVIACPPARRSGWAHVLKGADVAAEVIAPELDELGPLALARYAEHRTLLVGIGPLSLRDRVVKRVFDVALVLMAAPLVMPVMAAVAIAIKLNSRGPVFFRQPRVGQGNRSFDMIKFRSMYTDQADATATQLTRRTGDARVTKVGRFIRTTSLDELPQVLNVLRGEMSIVGPRPHAPGARAADRLYWDIDERYWHRHAMRPGLTGLAQVRGFRGATEAEVDLIERLQADLEYVADWSLWRDVGIIIATFRVLNHRNAF